MRSKLRFIAPVAAMTLYACGGSANDQAPTAAPTPQPQPRPYTTQVVVYERSDAVAYSPTVAPGGGIPGAQVTLASASQATSPSGSVSLAASLVAGASSSPLDVAANNYQSSTYPWYPADTAATVAVGLYPAVAVTPRPGFVKGIDFFDAGGVLRSIYLDGRHANVMDRARTALSANLVRTSEAFGVTKFSAATNSVVMTFDPFNFYTVDTYSALVSQAKSRGLQFEMGFEFMLTNAADSAAYYTQSQVPLTNTAFWDAYFAAFRTLVLSRAALARDLGVEYIDFTKLESLSHSGSARFRQLVSDIRALGYKGKIIYYYRTDLAIGNMEWTSMDAEFRSLWDLSGIALFTVVTPAAHETLADFQPRARMKVSVADALTALAAATPQPIMVMMRVPSVFGGVVHGDYVEPCTRCGGSVSISLQRTRDYQQQADAHQAVAEVVNATPMGNGRVVGLVSSQYFYYDDLYWLGGWDFSKASSVRDKPAESVLAWWFKRW